MITLRSYQTRTIDLLRAAYQAGRRAPCLVMPCAAGKTIVSASIMANAAAKRTRSLFVADRSTLIDQTVAKVRAAGVADLRVIQADRDEGPADAMITIASAQTLRMEKWQDALPHPDLVIWDECHGVVARTYDATLKRWPRALLLGLTATPCRADNQPLSTFDCIVVGATIAELTALGHLARPHVLRPTEGAVRDGQIALDPVVAYHRHAGGQRTAVFCATVAQATRYRSDFIAAGINACTVTATTRDRAAIIAGFAAGAFPILISVGCLTQGWDDPGCSVAIVARKPHIGMWIQICGRVLRPYPGKKEGLILDLCGAFWQHGSPDRDIEYSLDGKAISSVVKESLAQCRKCGSMFTAGPRECPYCGAVMPTRARKLPRAVGVELTDGATAPAPRREYVVTMVSTRHGWCDRCRGPITPGDQILWATVAKRARHQDCAA